MRNFAQGLIDGLDKTTKAGFAEALLIAIGDLKNKDEREWAGLTKEEIAEFDTWHDNREEEVGWCNPSEIVAYIEAKLKQKNGIKE